MQNSQPSSLDTAPGPQRALGAEHSNGAHPITAPPISGSAGAGARPGADPGVGVSTLDVLFELGGGASDAARRLLDVLSDRAWLAMRRSVLRTALAVLAGASAALWVGASLLAVFRGACEGLAALWGGRVWFGQLAGGLLGLASALGLLFIAMRVDSWLQLRRLRLKYRPIKSPAETARTAVGPQ